MKSLLATALRMRERERAGDEDCPGMAKEAAAAAVVAVPGLGVVDGASSGLGGRRRRPRRPRAKGVVVAVCSVRGDSSYCSLGAGGTAEICAGGGELIGSVKG